MPRSAWADVGAAGPLEVEEVRFLLVHHTASSTQHQAEDVPEILRRIRSFHVDSRGWNDIAYNFLIDRYGSVWEGREGSMDGPVRGDATGGNQGYSQLVCLIGDFTDAPPTEEAQQALVATLSWLAARYGIDVSPGASVSFVSRGSNRWPEGTEVTTTAIAAHRDMSLTTCPGDAFYPMLASAITPAVADTAITSSSTTSTTVEAVDPPPTSVASASTVPQAADSGGSSGPGLGWSIPLLVGGVLAGVIGWRMRRMNRP